MLRFSNLVFEPLWSRQYIRNVQVRYTGSTAVRPCDSTSALIVVQGGLREPDAWHTSPFATFSHGPSLNSAAATTTTGLNRHSLLLHMTGHFQRELWH